jgi:hypothetical protein
MSVAFISLKISLAAAKRFPLHNLHDRSYFLCTWWRGLCCPPLCLDCFLHLSPVSSVLWVEWSIGWAAARAGVYLTHTNNLLRLSGQRQAVWDATEACKRHGTHLVCPRCEVFLLQSIATQLLEKFHRIRRSYIWGSPSVDFLPCIVHYVRGSFCRSVSQSVGPCVGR